MKKPKTIFMTHAVTITGFDTTACSFNNGMIETLCVQIIPGYCPSAEWVRTFKQQYHYPEHAFAITDTGISYLTVATSDLTVDALQKFACDLVQVVERVNGQTGGERIIESVPITACGLPIRQDVSALLASIAWQ